MNEVEAGGKTGGNSAVTTGASQLVATSKGLNRGLTIVATDTNSAKVYVGFSSAITADAAATGGFPLNPGEGISFEIDDASKVYVIAAAGTQSVNWLGV